MKGRQGISNHRISNHLTKETTLVSLQKMGGGEEEKRRSGRGRTGIGEGGIKENPQCMVFCYSSLSRIRQNRIL